MAVKKEHFGRMADGREISLYTIDNGTVSASFTDLGAVWVSMMVPDRNGDLADVLLGYDDAEGYLVNGPHFGSIVGRIANRTGGASFTLNGTSYVLGKNKERTTSTAVPIITTGDCGPPGKWERILWCFFWTVPTATRDFLES